MRLGITAKLFLALLAVSILVVLAMSVASRISFTRGFLGYLNDQGIERIERLLPTVAAEYERHGSWEFLRGRPKPWFDLLRLASDEATLSPGSRDARTPPSTALLGLDLRIGLLDADGALVAGNPEVASDAARRAVRVNGETVGWLAVVPFQKVGGGADLRFQQRQQRMTWLIAAISVLLAAGVAVWLASRLLGRVRRVTDAVHRLAAGDYNARVPVSARDEISVLAEDCNRLAQALQRTEQTRRAFMADVSHELRTPLAVLRGELEALEDGVRQPTIESIRSLQSEVGTLSGLVDDLFNLSLSDAAALAYRMEDIDICEGLHRTLDSFRERLTERRISLDTHGLESGLRVKGDPERLRQLFVNIIENTVRYTTPAGTLRVECRKEGTCALIEFQDTAPGVSDEALPRLFERFYRVEGSRSRASGGAGLGLAISKNIVEAHGGNITARQSPLGGLLIAISLPLIRP